MLASLLTSLGEGDALFIDEIHRLAPVVEENLYPAMEDFRFDLFIGEGPHAKAVTMQLPRFTLLGATTRMGLLSRAAARSVRLPLAAPLLRARRT